jgi:hypothetical protein
MLCGARSAHLWSIPHVAEFVGRLVDSTPTKVFRRRLVNIWEAGRDCSLFHAKSIAVDISDAELVQYCCTKPGVVNVSERE